MIMIVSFWGKGDSEKVRDEFLSVIKNRWEFIKDNPQPRIKNDRLRRALAIVDLEKEEYFILTDLAKELDEDAIVRWI